RAAPDGDAAVGVPLPGGVVRLDVALVNRGGAELTLDHDGGLGEPPGDVAELKTDVLGDVGRFPGCAVGCRAPGQRFRRQVGVQQRGAVGHGGADVEDGGQRFVHDVDQADRLLGDVPVDGGDGGDGVALVEHLLARQDVAAQVPQ